MPGIRTKNASARKVRHHSSASTLTIDAPSLLPIQKLTGGDLSPDGTELLLRNNSQVYYWKRQAGETIAQTLMHQPWLVPTLQEPQGEDVCWTPDGRDYWTTSEFGGSSSAPVHKYYRKH